MIIDNISYSGLQEIYDYLQQSYTEWTKRRVYGSTNRSRALNYCEIDYEISDISPIEFLMLQGFTDGNGVYRGETMIMEAGDIPEDLPNAEKELIAKSAGFYQQTYANENTGNFIGDMVRMPVMDRCKAIVRFKGMKILSLMHCTSMTDFFTEWLKDVATRPTEDTGISEIKFPLWDDLFKEISEVKPKLSLTDYLAQGFLSNFYKYWRDMIKGQDIASNAFIHFQSYNGLSYNKPVLQEIRFPEGCISLGAADPTKIGENINALKEWSKKQSELSLNELVPITRMTLYSEIYMTVSVKASLATFLWLVRHLPYRMINDYEDLLVVIGRGDAAPIDDAERFKIRKAQTSKKAWELIESYHSNNPLRMMDFIPYETMIAFTLMGSVADFGIVTKTLHNWLGDTEDELHESLAGYELHDIVKTIDTFEEMVRGTAEYVDYK